MKRTESNHVYLNVDLEVRSRHDLTPLAEALRSRLDVLHAGRVPGSGFLVSFEVPGLSLSPDVAITRLARALSALPRSARRLWTLANDRVFDIGMDAAAVHGSYPISFRQETVRTIARLNARIAVTLYSRPKTRRKRRTTG